MAEPGRVGGLRAQHSIVVEGPTIPREQRGVIYLPTRPSKARQVPFRLLVFPPRPPGFPKPNRVSVESGGRSGVSG